MSQGIYLASEQIKIKSYALRDTLKDLGHDVGLQTCQEALARSFSGMTFIQLLEKEKTDYARPTVAKDGSIVGYSFHPQEPTAQYSLEEINALVERCKRENKPLPAFVPPEPRPTKVGEETLHAILTKKVEEFVASHDVGIDPKELFDLMADLYPFNESVFEMGQFASEEGWEVGDDLLEFFSGLKGLPSSLSLQETTAWLERNKIVPPFPVGTKTTKGVISKIFAGQGCCTVKPYDFEAWAERERPLHGVAPVGLLVNYEDLVLI